ncbi:helix-turn-helix domain-containing protein [Amycolatopsis pittospori]|uniref:helix-turn-helix domain-containing protein n=1 Tax=Amycolatopsis pittospori TaxID=2749434 RepID=UPI002E2C4101|nr:helix-turn-helix domain-containing protein [Amycolatopsis pittospori]
MERELIAFGLGQGKSFGEVGAWIGRDRSAVSREVGRNGGGRIIRRWLPSAGLIG